MYFRIKKFLYDYSFILPIVLYFFIDLYKNHIENFIMLNIYVYDFISFIYTLLMGVSFIIIKSKIKIDILEGAKANGKM